MKTNDKVLAAFLVSMGLFSGVQAVQYVSSLSAKEKQDMMPVTNMVTAKAEIVADQPWPTPVSENMVPDRFVKNA